MQINNIEKKEGGLSTVPIDSKDDLQRHLGLGLHHSCTDKSLTGMSLIMLQGILSLTEGGENVLL